MAISDIASTRLADTKPKFNNTVVARQPRTAPEIPARYQILSEIGSGGSGIVYKVHDLETEEVVALKILKPEIASDPTTRENLRREVCLARKVTHKNVCRIYEFNRLNSTACISMEFVDGESVHAKIQRLGSLSVRDAIDITRQICAGLHEAHEQGIVHRDLKPANIVVDHTGIVKIMDFGIARLFQENCQVTRTVVGTPEYMSPEQVELKALTPHTDIYSLGLVLYEMVTGVRAFSGDCAISIAVQHIRQAPKRPSEILSTLPPQVEAVILRCLRKQPAKRFQSVHELDAALAKCIKPAAAHTQKFDLEPLLHSGIQMANAAASQVGSLAGELRRAGVALNLSARPALRNWFLHGQELLTPTRARLAQVAAIVGVAVISTAVTFGLVANRKSHARLAATQPQRASAGVILPSGKPKVAPVALAVTLPSSEIADDGSAEALSAGGDSSLELSDSDSMPGRLPRHTSLTFAAMMKKAKAKARSEAQPTQPNSIANAPLPLPPAGTDPVIALNAAPVAASIPSPSVSTKAASSSTNPDNTSIVPLSYLEVGSFKDATSARSEVDQLTHLGFHAICIHKNHLWMQSYHVQVGPYNNSNDIEAAGQRLAAQGLEASVVK
jgi:cell division septation protein DedD